MRTRCSRCRAGVALSLSLQHAALALRRSQVSLSWRMRSWALTQGGNPQRRAFVFPPGGRLEMPITVTEPGWDGSGLMGQPLPVKWGRHHFVWRAGWQTGRLLTHLTGRIALVSGYLLQLSLSLSSKQHLRTGGWYRRGSKRGSAQDCAASGSALCLVPREGSPVLWGRSLCPAPRGHGLIPNKTALSAAGETAAAGGSALARGRFQRCVGLKALAFCSAQ